MKKAYIISFLLSVVFFSCSQGLSKYGELFTQLMITDEGVFRGLELGDAADKVLELEKSTLEKSTEDLAVFSGELGNSGLFSINYGFSEGILDEILVDVEFSDKSEGLELLRGLRSYYNDRFGLYIKDGGYLVWKGNTEDSPDVVIEMNDESEFNDYGQLVLSFYIQAKRN